jgi:putative transcriptional regulator
MKHRIEADHAPKENTPVPIPRPDRWPARKSPARPQDLQPGSIAGIRAQLGLSQERFAQAFGISVDTLQNWEQGRRQPTGPAKVLLRIAAKNPAAMLKAVA